MTRLKNLTQTEKKHLIALSNWLFFCAASVFCMIIVGAITRLSESGLSMVEWRPLIGAIPPLSETEWNRVFDLYKQTPEFQKKNFWMDLNDFRTIFFWEWFHRLLGRLIGLIYALPFFIFLMRGWIPAGYKLKLWGLLILGMCQAVMGWYMVKSGLVDIPTVSHYRLAAHLSLAFIIYGVMLWLALTFRKTAQEKLPRLNTALFRHASAVLGILSITIIWGAFVAGLDAGLVYNDSYPLMGNTWIPKEIWFHKPVWLNFFENHAGVQFMHRTLAILTVLAGLSLSINATMRHKRDEHCFAFVGIMVLLQMALGIATLFSHVALPIAAAHQGGAVILLSAILMAMHAVSYGHKMNRKIKRPPEKQAA